MSPMNTLLSANRRNPFFVSAGLVLGLAALGACGGSGNLNRESVTGFPPGSIHNNPDPNAPSAQFVVDSNYGGQATSVSLANVYWGRLVDVEDNQGIPQATDLVVGEALTDGQAYEFSTNPVTEKTTVRIRYNAGTSQYDEAFAFLSSDSNLTLVADVGLNPVVTIPFIPRNAAILLKFDDLISRETIDGLTIRTVVGNPPNTPFLARVVPDWNHGDLAEFDGQQGLEFYTTRVVIDSTVSGAEAQGTNLPVNSLGFPGSLTLGQANLQVRVPTEIDPEANQNEVLTNPTHHPLSASDSGTSDPASLTNDVVRALRTGGTGDATGDPNNGFLADDEAPSILGSQPVVVGSNITPVPGFDGLFVTDLQYAFTPCALKLREGDVIQQTVSGCAVYGVVACPPGQTCGADQAAAGDIQNGTLAGVFFRYVSSGTGSCVGQSFQSGSLAQVGVKYIPGLHQGTEACFLTFSTIGNPPNHNVAPDATVSVRFSEAMDPTSITAFDTFTLTRYDRAYTDNASDPINTDPQTLPTSQPTYRNFVVGRVSAGSDLRTFTFRPSLPLTHVVGNTEAVYMTLKVPTPSDPGANDLAGNALEVTFDTPDTSISEGIVGFELDPTAPDQDTDGFAFRFNRQDMIPGTETAPGGGDPDNASFGKPEFRGQFLIDGGAELLRPRPVTRFQAAADRTQAVPSIMAPFPQGVQTPISRYGSKLQTLWRYCDVGFALQDEQFFNVDIEHLYWGPAGGAVIADTLPRLEIGLSHALKLPDESLDPNLLPNYPNSGIITTFAQNVLDGANDPLRTVHPGTSGVPGYVLQPINAVVTTTGTTVMPWPLNFGITPDRFTYFTWRNTAVLATGGLQGPGAELEIVRVVTGQGTPGVPYPPGLVPSVGMPLLMEFRCYPNDAISGQNSFDISLATASSPRPNFRAFSTGGFPTSGPPAHTVNPDLEPIAQGGFNPNSMPTPGAITPGVDNSFYIGATDLVIRISRVHSIWFDSGSAGVRYEEPIQEPSPSQQPTGTEIQVNFRGGSLVTNPAAITDADQIDVYGEVSSSPQPTFFQNDRTWRTSMAAISSPDGIQSGAKFFQLRLTFVSNAATNLSPTLSALGFAWRE